VICQTVEEFVENLNAEQDILQKTVYVSKTRTPVDGDKRSAAKFRVTFQASAIVNIVTTPQCLKEALEVEDGGQYLLEVGCDCGVDYEDASQDFEGSEEADRLKAKMVAYCEGRGLSVRPGIIDM